MRGESYRHERVKALPDSEKQFRQTLAETASDAIITIDKKQPDRTRQ